LDGLKGDWRNLGVRLANAGVSEGRTQGGRIAALFVRLKDTHSLAPVPLGVRGGFVEPLGQACPSRLSARLADDEKEVPRMASPSDCALDAEDYTNARLTSDPNVAVSEATRDSVLLFVVKSKTTPVPVIGYWV
jgi:hypothetical protein